DQRRAQIERRSGEIAADELRDERRDERERAVLEACPEVDPAEIEDQQRRQRCDLIVARVAEKLRRQNSRHWPVLPHQPNLPQSGTQVPASLRLNWGSARGGVESDLSRERGAQCDCAAGCRPMVSAMRSSVPGGKK